MTWSDEIRDSLTGSWQLLLRDPDAYGYFNQTETGFWRSFAAIVIIAPLYLYVSGIETSLAEAAPSTGEAPPARDAGLVLLSLLVQWALWPVVMVFAARMLALSKSYARYIIAYNWSSIIIIAAQAPLVIAFNAGLIGLQMAMVLLMLVNLFALYFRWYVARTGLETSGMIAFALVLGDFVLSVAANRFIG